MALRGHLSLNLVSGLEVAIQLRIFVDVQPDFLAGHRKKIEELKARSRKGP